MGGEQGKEKAVKYLLSKFLAHETERLAYASQQILRYNRGAPHVYVLYQYYLLSLPGLCAKALAADSNLLELLHTPVCPIHSYHPVPGADEQGNTCMLIMSLYIFWNVSVTFFMFDGISNTQVLK